MKAFHTQRLGHSIRRLVSGAVSGKSRLTITAACVFAFGMALSFGTAANDGGCNYECDRYCFTQFMWCGGFFNDHCYPEYLACTQACGCDIGG